MHWYFSLTTKLTSSSSKSSSSSLSPSSSSSVPVLFIWIIYLLCLLNTTANAAHNKKWPTPDQELADEINDGKIFSSIQRSMAEWLKTHKHHRKKRAEKSVCYNELGCFEDSGPFGYLDMLPSSPEEIQTKFLFYSTKNRSDRPLVELPYLNMTDAWQVFSNNHTNTNTTSATSTVLESNEASSSTNNATIKKNFNSKMWQSLKTFEGLDSMSVRVIVHGFGSSCPHVWIYEMRTALMAVEDCVVICVDWELGANLPNYVRAAANTRLIGKQLAMFLRGLQQYKGLNLSRVHIIGFSLGAHVSGFAGAELPGLSRITGLDPAGPLFESQHPKARLDSSDASFVDVIHSNGENLILGGLGSWQPMGHVDFYPNGGRVQHGCSNLFVGAVTDFIWSPAAAVEGRSLCNHRRAYKFFIDSVAPRCLFPAFPCESYDDFLKGRCFPCDKAQLESPEAAAKCGNMGYYADRSTGRGQLYLVTREEEPFCAHQFNIEIHSSENGLPLRTLGRLEAIFEGDGSLNETFSITEKDDSEFFAGDVISRILVPHPALGFPHSITLTYKSYSGWLSKGLPHWTIHKMVLTDSFGTKMSICKQQINLYSEKPVYLKLQPGDCYISDENDITPGPTTLDKDGTKLHVTENGTTKFDNKKEFKHSTVNPYDDDTNHDDLDRLREKKEIINLGTNFKITANSTYSYQEKTDQLPWHPVLVETSNSLDSNKIELRQSSGSVINLQLTSLKTNGETTKKQESGRAISDKNYPIVDEIIEPILKATTQKSRKMKNVNLENDHSHLNQASANEVVRPRENSFFTIQLLPFRLGELIERAERYARETLLPLISEQAPRFFGWGGGGGGGATTVNSDHQRNDRSPKYFPSLGEMAVVAAASGADASQPNGGNSPSNSGGKDSDIQETRVSERRIDLPPAFSTNLRIEQSDFDEDEIKKNDELINSKSRQRIIEDTTAAATITTTTTTTAVESLHEESRSNKDILSLLRHSKQNNKLPRNSQSQTDVNQRHYYTRNGHHGNKDSMVVHIDLPTYKPEILVNPISDQSLTTITNQITTTDQTPTTTTISTKFPYKFEDPTVVVPHENESVQSLQQKQRLQPLMESHIQVIRARSSRNI